MPTPSPEPTPTTTPTARAGTMSCSLKTDTNTYSVPSVTKPGYLQSYTDPVFGTKITRISGDPGASIASGGTWGSDVHHEYSKVQVWNADQTLMYIDNNTEGGSGAVVLDGTTYQPLYSRGCPGTECRWHPTDPTIMVYAESSAVGYWSVRANTKTPVATFAGYTSLQIGPWEGNLSLDGSMIVLSGNSPSGKSIAFAYDLVHKIKYPDIDVSSQGTSLDWTSISPKGDYVVASYGEDDHSAVWDLNGNFIVKLPAGHPSHYDMTVDQNGDEVAVGSARSAPYDGMVIKIRLKDASMTPLTTGGYAEHTSTRATNLRTFAVTSYTDSPQYPPYVNETVASNTDGSQVYRLAHHHGVESDYEASIIPSPSPDNLRVIFASNWGAASGRPVSIYVIDLRGLCTQK